MCHCLDSWKHIEWCSCRLAASQAQPANTTIATQITALSLNNIFPVYGQFAGYGTQITVPQGSSVPQGNIIFLNGSTVLATASLTGSGAVISGNNVVGDPVQY